jgi:hypothetical protein
MKFFNKYKNNNNPPQINLASKPVFRPALPPRQHKNLKVLQDHHIQFFITHGYLKAENCFSRWQCEQLMGDLWQRMGMTPDKSTWISERMDVPGRDSFQIKEFAPKVWDITCDLLGGEERVEEGSEWWDDGFIVNLGTPEGKFMSGLEANGWHVDGDYFVSSTIAWSLKRDSLTKRTGSLSRLT